MAYAFRMFISFLAGTLLLTSCSHRPVDAPNIPPQPSVEERDSFAPGFTRIAAPADAIYDIYFSDTLHGYCGGIRGLYRTSDGGHSWSLFSPIQNSRAIYRVTGKGNRVSYIQELTPALFYAANGGPFALHAYTSPDPNYPLIFQDIQFLSADTVLIASDRQIWKSVDGGATASVIYDFGVGEISSALYFLNSNTGWCLRSGTVYRTDNGGYTWTRQYSTGDYSRALQFVDAQTGFIGSGTRLFRSSDGGATATLIENFGTTSSGGLAFHFFNDQHGIVLNDGDAIRTTNGAHTWTLGADTHGMLYNLYFLDAHNGWICGDDSTIIRVRL